MTRSSDPSNPYIDLGGFLNCALYGKLRSDSSAHLGDSFPKMLMHARGFNRGVILFGKFSFTLHNVTYKKPFKCHQKNEQNGEELCN